MKWPFPVGTRVKMNGVGFRRYGTGATNPEGVLGTVERGDDGYGWATVNWDNGFSNSYLEGTIDPAFKPKLENK